MLASAGCASSFTAPNDATISIENEDDVTHTVQVTVSVKNSTVASQTSRIEPGTESTLNQTTIPVTGTDRRYRVRVSLENGTTNTTTFVEREFDSIKIVIESRDTISVGWVNAT
jgi:hypothetical protein